MKRQFLEELGIEKENVDKIMAEHGKSIKADNEVLTELEEAKTTAETLQHQVHQDPDRRTGNLRQGVPALCRLHHGSLRDSYAFHEQAVQRRRQGPFHSL